MLSTGRRATFK